MITSKDSKVTAFGGIHLVHSQILSKRFPQFINDVLGKRSDNAVYSYSDMFLNLCYTAFCGGECAEDINYLRATFEDMKNLKVPSADRLLGIQQELATEAGFLKSEGGSLNKINVNENLNEFLIKAATYLEVLDKQDTAYCLDFDHEFIPTEKHDATYSYKQCRGYFPGVASIGNIPVYIEGRNGNCHVNFQQLDTFKRVFRLLVNNGINVKRCRMDSGSYLKELTDYLHKETGALFYIRAEQSDNLLFEASVSEGWKKCSIGTMEYEVNSIGYQFGEYKHRIVAYRWPNKTGQINLSTADANNYLFIITNDLEWDEETIIRFYNQRGNSEKLFDIQNNDFNWKKMPFSFLEENTVYLILMAVCHVVYKWILSIFSKVFDFLPITSRLKRFIFRVICISAKVVRSGRRKIIKLFTKWDISAISYDTS